MTSTQGILIAVIGIAVLFWKGYIALPFGGGGGSKAEVLGKKFLATIRQEAEDEVAGLIVEKMKGDVKAKLQAPFGVAAPDAIPTDPK
jgi:hypothetical protein